MRIRYLIACFAMLAFSAQAAQKQSPLAESCTLVEALATGGADAGTKAIVEMASDWPDEDQIKLAAILRPAFQKFDYLGGDIYLVADLNNNMQEHLVTLRVEDGRVVYLRLLYEAYVGKLRFAHIELQEKYKKIATYAFAQKPVKLSCE